MKTKIKEEYKKILVEIINVIIESNENEFVLDEYLYELNRICSHNNIQDLIFWNENDLSKDEIVTILFNHEITVNKLNEINEEKIILIKRRLAEKISALNSISANHNELELFSFEEDEAISPEWIVEIESFFGQRIPADYYRFLETFGSIHGKINIYGIHRDNERELVIECIEMTKKYRMHGLDSNYLVIGNKTDEEIYVIDLERCKDYSSVLIFTLSKNKIKPVSNSFYSFLEILLN